MPPTFPAPLDCKVAPRYRHNRLEAILPHIPYYFSGVCSRLAQDCGVYPSTIWRLIHFHRGPSERLVNAIVNALHIRSGTAIPTEEIFSLDGNYTTLSPCELMGCKGCRPPAAWNEKTERLRPAWKNLPHRHDPQQHRYDPQQPIPLQKKPLEGIKKPGDLCPLTESQATGPSSLPKIQC